MLAEGDVCIEATVLVVVDYSVLSDFNSAVSVEEHNIAWKRRVIHLDSRSVDFVDPVGWNVLSGLVFQLILDIWAQHVPFQGNLNRLRVVD